VDFALLASLLGLDRLFQADAEDGSLDQFHLSHTPLELAVLAKCAAHWTTAGLPLALASPLFGLMLQQDGAALFGVVASLLAGTPALTLIGAIGAGRDRDAAARRPADGLLVLPLAIPVLIFGVSAANAAAGGTVPFLTPFSILCAIISSRCAVPLRGRRGAAPNLKPSALQQGVCSHIVLAGPSGSG